MSKKFGKFLLFSAVAGAAAYSMYYFLKSKDNAVSPEKAEDVDDDFDDFSEDLDEDTTASKERSYVSLNLDKAEAFASEAFHKAKEMIVDSVHQVKDTVKAVTETQAGAESNFTDLTALNKEKEAEEGTVSQDASSEESAEKVPSPAASDAPAAENGSSAESASPEAHTEKVEEFFDDDNP